MDWMREQIRAGFWLGNLLERGHFEKWKRVGGGRVIVVKLVRKESGSGSYPVAGFGKSGVEPILLSESDVTHEWLILDLFNDVCQLCVFYNLELQDYYEQRIGMWKVAVVDYFVVLPQFSLSL